MNKIYSYVKKRVYKEIRSKTSSKKASESRINSIISNVYLVIDSDICNKNHTLDDICLSDEDIERIKREDDTKKGCQKDNLKEAINFIEEHIDIEEIKKL